MGQTIPVSAGAGFLPSTICNMFTDETQMYSCCKTISNITSNSGHSFGVVMYFWIGLRNCKNGWYTLPREKKGVGIFFFESEFHPKFLVKMVAFWRTGFEFWLGLWTSSRFWRRCLDGPGDFKGSGFDGWKTEGISTRRYKVDPYQFYMGL